MHFSQSTSTSLPRPHQEKGSVIHSRAPSTHNHPLSSTMMMNPTLSHKIQKQHKTTNGMMSLNHSFTSFDKSGMYFHSPSIRMKSYMMCVTRKARKVQTLPYEQVLLDFVQTSTQQELIPVRPKKSTISTRKQEAFMETPSKELLTTCSNNIDRCSPSPSSSRQHPNINSSQQQQLATEMPQRRPSFHLTHGCDTDESFERPFKETECCSVGESKTTEVLHVKPSHTHNSTTHKFNNTCLQRQTRRMLTINELLN